jgi:glycosyltransferase involved in cell wall biosynthesis
VTEPAAPQGLRVLFVKESLSWPRSSGHDIHCFYMMRALAGQGHAVGLVTAVEPVPDALTGLPLALRQTFPPPGQCVAGPEPRLTRLQERFRNYWGIDLNRLRAVGRTAEEFRADAVVVVGLGVLPYLGAVEGPLRIWYAADEWAWHHLSQVRLLKPSTWGDIKTGVIKGLYERAYRNILDAVWVVSETDRRWMRRVTGARVEMLYYGVNGEHFTPRERPQRPKSCAFWGRLDFGPNLQGLEWFCGRIWPVVRRAHPDAAFTIYGFQPTPRAHELGSAEGVSLIPDLPDLRDEIAAHEVVVLPFVSGGGVKNKLLEAAAMGKAIVCTPQACSGLRGSLEGVLRQARTPAEWARELTLLWADAHLRRRLGDAGRRWVTEQHTWEAAARSAAAGLESMLQARRSA